MTEAASVDRGTRIQTIQLQDFRGFRSGLTEPKTIHILDTDADIVLITGPNGYGKTSLLEALLLVLTGWHGYDDPVKDLISHYRNNEKETDRDQPDKPETVAAAEPRISTAENVTLEWTSSSELPFQEMLSRQCRFSTRLGERSTSAAGGSRPGSLKRPGAIMSLRAPSSPAPSSTTFRWSAASIMR
jgi:hypothetical protein